MRVFKYLTSILLSLFLFSSGIRSLSFLRITYCSAYAAPESIPNTVSPEAEQKRSSSRWFFGFTSMPWGKGSELLLFLFVFNFNFPTLGENQFGVAAIQVSLSGEDVN